MGRMSLRDCHQHSSFPIPSSRVLSPAARVDSLCSIVTITPPTTLCRLWFDVPLKMGLPSRQATCGPSRSTHGLSIPPSPWLLCSPVLSEHRERHLTWN